MGSIIYIVLNISRNNNVTSYEELSKILIGNKKVVNNVLNNIINIFLLISFFVMVAGFGAYFLQEFNIPSAIGSLIITLLSYIVMSKNMDGIIKINEYLIPILIMLIIILGIKCKISFNIITQTYIENNFLWIIKSILYASYNSIILIPILLSLSKLIINKKDIKLISIVVTTIMIILSIFIYLIIHIYFEEIKNIEIPILYIANGFGKGYKGIYGITILIAIFTTAISAEYSLLSNMCKTKKQYKILAITISIIAILMSNIGFSNLLNSLYPTLGIIGIMQIFLLFKRSLNRKTNS